MTKLRTVAVAIIALYVGNGAAAGPLKISDENTILVTADEVWEEPEQNIFHFRGNFELRTPRWAVMADEATVYGRFIGRYRPSRRPYFKIPPEVKDFLLWLFPDLIC